MTGGINHAKRIVLDEAKCLAEKLDNGKANCVETQGKAISLIVKMLSPIYEAEFVTTEECHKKRDECSNGRSLKLKLGSVGIEGNLPPVILICVVLMSCFGGLIFVIGRTNSWW